MNPSLPDRPVPLPRHESRTLLLAVACGLIAANLYYAQPLAGVIAAALGVPADAAGLLITVTQLGYAAGLLLIVPLGDLMDKRTLVVALLILTGLGLLAAALAPGAGVFLPAAFVTGVGSVAVQVLVAHAAQIAPEATRGRDVGTVMSGLMLGIMLARPVSSLLAGLASWHAIFLLSALLMLVLAVLLALALPRARGMVDMHYGRLLASMAALAWHTPVLRQRALHHAFLFAAFSLFWTAVPLHLAGPAFRLSQTGIAWFALAGVAGAIAAPIAGRLADSGWTRPATIAAALAVAFAFVAGHPAPSLAPGVGLAWLVAAAILLDAGVAMNLVLSQRAIFLLPADQRSRLNGMFMAAFFAGGAAGSALGGWAYAHGGWQAATWAGLALPIVALAVHCLRRSPRPQRRAVCP